MTNDITISHIRPSTAREPVKPEGESGNRSSAPPDAVTTDDRVTLTREGIQRQTSAASITTGEVTDAGKVEAVRAAINAGRYSVDAEAVADKMLSLERQLFGPGDQG